MFAVVLARRERAAKSATVGGVAPIAAAPAIFLAIVGSLSGSGFISCLASLALMGILVSSRRVGSGWRWAAAGAVAALTVVAFLVVPPDPVVERFAGEAKLGEGSRPALWGETLKAVPTYPVFGCRLGAYESALYRTSDIMHDRLIHYAHNDYLQLLLELGAVGFAIGIGLVVAIVRPAVRVALAEPRTERGALAIACIGGMAAFLIHCVCNFNFYAPANAMMAAMIGGIAVKLEGSKTRRMIGDYNQIIDGVLWVGAFVRPEDAERLRKMGITVVLSLQTNEDLRKYRVSLQNLVEALNESNIDLRRAPVRDFDRNDLELRLPACVTALEEALAPGWAKAYLHCTAGVMRSATVAAGYLIKVCYMPAGIACAYVTSKRECQPDLEILKEYEKGLRGV